MHQNCLQLELDLLSPFKYICYILLQNGLPSPENPYIFNGDFVDRGKKSLEVFLLLLACLLAFPGGIFLNRGNHEDTVMNARYGFINEVNTKYPVSIKFTHNFLLSFVKLIIIRKLNCFREQLGNAPLRGTSYPF